MMDSILKALQVVFALVSIVCFAAFFYMIGHKKGYLDGRLSIRPRIEELTNKAEEIESIVKQMEQRYDSIDELIKEEQK